MNKLKYLITVLAISIIIFGSILLLMPNNGVVFEIISDKELTYSSAISKAYSLFDDEKHDVMVTDDNKEYYTINIIDNENSEIASKIKINKKTGSLYSDEETEKLETSASN